MHAVCGDMCIQGVDHLNLSGFRNVHFPPQMKDYFALSKLWLPKGFSGEPPLANMYWVYTSNLDDLQINGGKYTLVLDGPPPDALIKAYAIDLWGGCLSGFVWDVAKMVGFMRIPIQQCVFLYPEEVEGTPKWCSLLVIVKIPPYVRSMTILLNAEAYLSGMNRKSRKVE